MHCMVFMLLLGEGGKEKAQNYHVNILINTDSLEFI